MTQNESKLKTQYPLSPKKFKKKMIEKAFLFIFVSGFLGAMPVIVGISNYDNPMSPLIIAGVITFLVSYLLLMFIYGIYVHYYIKTYYYEDNNDFLTIRKGPITPAEIHVQYAKIQDVYVDQDILDRIFGIYDVHISSATYTSGIEAHIDGVDKQSAEALKNLFLYKIKGGSSDNSSQPISNQDQSNFVEKTPIKNVNFSKPISSDEYGLGSNWWIGEFVKIAIGSVFYPAIITLWFTFSGKDNDKIINWNIVSMVWFAVLVLYIIYRIIYLLLWKTHYKYNFGPEYIYIKTGIISISEKNMGYNSIQDVGIRQTLIDRIFGVADLVIENASGATMPARRNDQRIAMNGINIEGLSLADAQSVSDELKKVIINKRDSFNKGL